MTDFLTYSFKIHFYNQGVGWRPDPGDEGSLAPTMILPPQSFPDAVSPNLTVSKKNSFLLVTLPCTPTKFSAFLMVNT